MAIQFSVAVRNAQLDSIETAMGVSAHLQIWTGAPPANCGAASSGVKLVDVTLASDWAAAAAAGSKSLNGLPINTTAIIGGTMGHYRFVDSAGTTCHEQGTVAMTGADMIVDNSTVTTGQTVSITGFTKTAAGA